MSSPEKKKKKTTVKEKQSLKPSLVVSPTPGSTSNPSLPDDLLLSCFGRVSKLHYPTLSLASKTFRSLLASPEQYETRSLLRNKESCLYVCLGFDSEPNPRWFTLCLKPNNTDSTKKSSGYVLAPISIPISPEAHWEGFSAVIGSDIYAIGGPINGKPSSSVFIFDCRSHTWREAPNMLVERSHPAVNVYEGKIYVGGGFGPGNSSNWMEVYDPKTETWELVPCLLAETWWSRLYRSAVIEGVIFMFGYKGVAYDPREKSWRSLKENTRMRFGWESTSYCVIDDVLYCYKRLNGFRWYDTKVDSWKPLKGLVGLPKFGECDHLKLAEYGGNKMAVLWDKDLASSGCKKKVIWCAEISLERRCDDEEEEEEDEIWGKVEWLDVVLTVPESCGLFKVIAATL